MTSFAAKWSARLTVVGGALVFAASMACAAAQEPTGKIYLESKANLENTFLAIKRPKNPVELLQNIKIAYDKWLLLRREFIDDEFLKTFVGGTTVSRISNRSKHVLIRISPIYDFSPNLGALLPTVSINITSAESNKLEQGEGKGLRVVMNGNIFRDKHFSVESVIAIFGQPQRITDPYIGRNHVIILMKKSHEYGNSELTYLSNSSEGAKKLSFTANGDGTICCFKLTEEVR
jgi:hypothetical protein